MLYDGEACDIDKTTFSEEAEHNGVNKRKKKRSAKKKQGLSIRSIKIELDDFDFLDSYDLDYCSESDQEFREWIEAQYAELEAGQESHANSGLSSAELKTVKQRNKRRHKRKETAERKEFAAALPFASISIIPSLEDKRGRTGNGPEASEVGDYTRENIKRRRHKPDAIARSIIFFVSLAKPNDTKLKTSDSSSFGLVREVLQDAKQLEVQDFSSLDEMQHHAEQVGANLANLRKHIKLWPRCFDRALHQIFINPSADRDTLYYLQVGIDILNEMVEGIEKQSLILSSRIQTTNDFFLQYQKWNRLWEDQVQLTASLERTVRTRGSSKLTQEEEEHYNLEALRLNKIHAGEDSLKEILTRKEEAWHMYKTKLGLYRPGITGIAGRDLIVVEVRVLRRRYQTAFLAFEAVNRIALQESKAGMST